MTSDDLKILEELLYGIRNNMDDPQGQIDELIQYRSEERARTLNSEAVQGIVKYSKALIDRIPYTVTLHIESGIKQLEDAIEKFQQFKDGK